MSLNNIELEIIGLSSNETQSGSFALVMGEKNGNRKIPIIIGMSEAQAIAIEIEKIVPNRPMTHDLFKVFSHLFDIKISKIFISNLKEGVFFAKMMCEHDGKNFEIDSRPSDAIAIGLRFNVGFFTNEAIMSQAGMVLSSNENDYEGRKEPKTPSKNIKNAKKDVNSEINDMSLEQLKVLLRETLEREDYERAALLRDELNKRNL